MGKTNYQIILSDTINKLIKENRRPSLLLHSCCAPCSSYVLEYLCDYFDITLLYYNPNITFEEEYMHRYDELKRLVKDMKLDGRVGIMDCVYDPDAFFKLAKGLEKEPEGQRRCTACYELRLRKTAECAAAGAFDYFTTTLSISPLKNAEKLNNIGAALAKEYSVPYLFSDFKKKGGYKRSIELSAEYGLYRQDYCGCIYSKLEREEIKKRKLQQEVEHENIIC